jgi:hypothetical protein
LHTELSDEDFKKNLQMNKKFSLAILKQGSLDNPRELYFLKFNIIYPSKKARV